MSSFFGVPKIINIGSFNINMSIKFLVDVGTWIQYVTVVKYFKHSVMFCIFKLNLLSKCVIIICLKFAFP